MSFDSGDYQPVDADDAKRCHSKVSFGVKLLLDLAYESGVADEVVSGSLGEVPLLLQNSTETAPRLFLEAENAG